MMDTLDGDYQSYKSNDGAFVRKNFFGRDPKTLEMVAKMSDDDIWRLQRGGHDPQKVYAAYDKAVKTVGQPTVLLIKTVKGYGMGKSGEAKNTPHQTKKLTDDGHQTFRDSLDIPIPDDKLADIPFFKPEEHTPEMKYLHARRKALDGYLPQRRAKADEQLAVPDLSACFQAVLAIPTAEGRRSPHARPTCASPDGAAARQAAKSAARGAHPGRRRARASAWKACPPDRHLQPRGRDRDHKPPGDTLPTRRHGRPDGCLSRKHQPARQGGVCARSQSHTHTHTHTTQRWVCVRACVYLCAYATNNRVVIPFYVYYSMFGFPRAPHLTATSVGRGRRPARGFLL